MKTHHDALDTSALDQSIGYLLRRSARFFREATVPTLRESGLSPLELTTLALIKSNPDCILRTLADAVGVEPPAMNRITNNLEKKALIIRLKSQKDARFTYFRISTQGQVLMDTAAAPVNEVEEQALCQLTETERQALFKALLKLR